MLNDVNWGALVAQSLRRPAQAAQVVLSWNLPRDALWTAMALVTLCNAVLMYVTNIVTPPLPPELAAQAIPFPAWMFSPLTAFVFLAGSLVVTVHVLHWLSSLLGGPGGLNEMLALLTWLQALRAVAQFVFLVLLIAVPGLEGLFNLAVAVMSMWLLVVFVNEASGLQSKFKAVGVLLTAAVGIIVGLSFLITLTGFAAIGV
ncbi:YIP1 family protein [Ascidiaceihabitans sp.]|uniref:YIP1 family protein n=1 Tax=Ascidiaceihabitans sp. TaxID=1872644 RepID=UPI0032978009